MAPQDRAARFCSRAVTKATNSRRSPDRSAALAQYRRRARLYDLELAPFEPFRRRAIVELDLQPGDTVLDIGCGTGLSFTLLETAIGAQGRIVGIDQSPDMLALAGQRVDRMKWHNVTLVCSPVEEAQMPPNADAALFHFTHDILRRPEAVGAVVAHLRPGARVVAVGLKWADPWGPLVWPTNLLVWSAALYSVTSIEGLEAPWSHLAAQVAGLDVQTALMGSVYIARGELPSG